MAGILDIYKIFEKHFGEEEAKLLTEADLKMYKGFKRLNLWSDLKSISANTF